MAEIQITRIKSIYGEIKGIFAEIPKEGNWIDFFIIQKYNDAVNRLSQVSETDYKIYTIPESEQVRARPGSFDILKVRICMGGLLGKLESEFGFAKQQENISSPTIAIFNQNRNGISIQVNYTIQDLISRSPNSEVKNKLSELDNEMNNSTKNWDKIKCILIWIINFSKDLFLEILPLILKNKI